MVSRGAFFFLGNHHRFAFGTHEYFVFGTLEIIHVHQALVATRGEQRRLVHQIRQISTRHARRTARNDFCFDIGRNRHLAHMHQQNLFTPAYVRQWHHYLPVKTARTQQRRIKHIRPVGCRNHDHARIRLKTIHLDQQLIQRLLALVVTAAQTRTALTAHRVNLVDEHNTRRVLFRVLEHVTHACRAYADKHFHKVRTGNREKRHFSLARNGTRQQRFTGTRTTHHQHATWNASPKLLEF